MKRLSSVTTAHLLMLMIACGRSDNSDDIADVSSSLEGTHHGHVVSQLLVPATSQQQEDFGLDLGGSSSSALDGHNDNKLGNALVMFANLGIQLQPTVNTAVDRGALLVLADLQTTSFVDATEAGLRLLVGANPQPPPCGGADDKICRLHLDGNATFSVDPDAPSSEAVTGPIVSGVFTRVQRGSPCRSPSAASRRSACS